MLSSFNHSKSILKIYAQPNSKKSEIVGLYGEDKRLKIRLKARPTDGEANIELIKFLSNYLSIPQGRFEILRGHVSKKKDLVIDCPLTEIQAKISEYYKN